MCRLDDESLESLNYLAHSARSEQDITAQSYCSHIYGVTDSVKKYCEEISDMLPDISPYLFEVCINSAEYHDLGKLTQKNQNVLSGKVKANRLPIDHTDAGSVFFLNKIKTKLDCLKALIVYAHHRGLPNNSAEASRTSLSYRSENAESRKETEKNLTAYCELHERLVGTSRCTLSEKHATLAENKINGVFIRQCLSVLVDADHSDTACNYKKSINNISSPKLRANERLNALDKYVDSLSGNKSEESERNQLRSAMYMLSKKAGSTEGIYWCDSPVGTGKTTAVMANLLKVASEKKLRRIFVVLPFTNIINQSVKVYRDALVLPGENPEEVVAAVHHRAEYEDISARQMSVQWNSPIIVTTAVQFFETLAAANTSGLRKLHCLPGSAVFIDEAHTALPIKLWPVAWHWLKEYAGDWRCHFVLASGSLYKFWKLEEFDKNKPNIPPMLPEEFTQKLNSLEKARIQFSYKPEKMDEDELCEWLDSLPAPRIVILNTVQSAAVVANIISEKYGRKKVEHISTALTPKDREKTIDKIKKRLDDRNDTDWTLVATSCVEAGINFSFRTGVREAASLVSLLQLAGRVRRNNEQDYIDSVVWTIGLKYEKLLKPHPMFEKSAEILLKFFRNQEEIAPSLCTKALRQEILQYAQFKETLIKQEESFEFKGIEDGFKVIDSNSVTVIINEALKDRLENKEFLDWREIQDDSVQIWSNKIAYLKITQIKGFKDMYFWPYKYDSFIGYMSGFLNNQKSDFNGYDII